MSVPAQVNQPPPTHVADEVLATLVGVLGGGLLAIATLAGAFLWRRIQELQKEMQDLRLRLEKLRPYEEAIAKFQGELIEKERRSGRAPR